MSFETFSKGLDNNLRARFFFPSFTRNLKNVAKSRLAFIEKEKERRGGGRGGREIKVTERKKSSSHATSQHTVTGTLTL